MSWLDWINAAMIVAVVVYALLERVIVEPDERFEDDDRLNFRS